MEETKAVDVEEETLPALCERIRPKLRRVLWHHRIPAQDAEDLVQTTLLLALAKWRGIANPEAWLLATLDRRCLMYWRVQRREARRRAEMDGCDPNLFATESPQGDRDRLTDLDRAIRELPPAQRRLLVARFRLGLTAEAAAQAAGVAIGSIGKTTSRAIEGLRRRLAGEGTEPQAPKSRKEPQTWEKATTDYLRQFKPATSQTYASHLRNAGSSLGCIVLDELTAAQLLDYRARVLADGRSRNTQAKALSTLRSFLLWASGRHYLDLELIRGVLRPPATIAA